MLRSLKYAPVFVSVARVPNQVIVHISLRKMEVVIVVYLT